MNFEQNTMTVAYHKQIVDKYSCSFNVVSRPMCRRIIVMQRLYNIGDDKAAEEASQDGSRADAGYNIGGNKVQ
jgi:hypothetical protein